MKLKNNHGFTLVELLVVVAIIGILAAVSFSSYAGFRDKRAVESEVMKLTAVIREVMERSKSQTDGSGWGVRFANPPGTGIDFYEIWKGSSYASGTVTQRINFDANVGFTNPADGMTRDVIFGKATGLPSASTTLMIQSLSGGGTGQVNIDTSGRVDYTLN